MLVFGSWQNATICASTDTGSEQGDHAFLDLPSTARASTMCRANGSRTRMSHFACALNWRSCTMAPLFSPATACGRQALMFPRTAKPCAALARPTFSPEHHEKPNHAARPRQRRLATTQAMPPVAAAAAEAAPPASQRPSAQDLPLLLDGVRIVLVSPKTPANIGAVLRVAENFEVRAEPAPLRAGSRSPWHRLPLSVFWEAPWRTVLCPAS